MDRIKAKRHRRSLLEAAITSFVLSFTAPCALAQTTWKGGTGNWNVAGNWTPGVVPNGSTISVAITGTSGDLSSVTLNNLAPTIQNLSLDSFSTLTIQSGESLYLAGSTITNAGQINVGLSSSAAILYVGPSVTLSGGGTVSLNNAKSVFESTFQNSTLVNQSTIQGQGDIRFFTNFNNQGTVNANVPGGTLQLSVENTTNTGTLEATGGGTLNFYGVTVTNTGGTISTDSSSSVTFNQYSAIIGGNLTSTGGGVIHGLLNTTLQGVTITPGSIYSVDAGNTNYLTGNLVNQGTVLIGGSAGAGTLQLVSPTGTALAVNLTGGGTVNLSNASSVITVNPGDSGNLLSLVNKDNTIQGQGSIYGLANFTNQGTVNANVSGGTLSIGNTLFNSGQPTTNTGTLEATGGGTLSFFRSTVTNTNGTISAGNSSSVIIGGNATIIGGNLTSSGTGEIHAQGASFQGVTITSGSTFSVDGGSFSSPSSLTGNLTNQGTVLIGNSASAGILYIAASTVNLSGGGTVTLNNANSEISYETNSSLVNKDNTIQGQGFISGLTNFTNGGTVNANVAGGTLEIVSGGTTTNTGTLEATGGGTLEFSNRNTVTNTNGTIFAGNSSSVTLTQYSTIIGGNLTSTGSGEIHGSGAATLSGVTITAGSTYSVDPGSITYLAGNLVNQGTVLIGSSSSLEINASAVTLSGGGTINLNNATSEIVGVASPGAHNLVNQDNTIQGQGYFNGYLSSFINGGTVSANVSGGMLTIEAPTTNNGTFQVTEGSTLQVLNNSFTNTGTVNIGALKDTSASLFQVVATSSGVNNDYIQTDGTTSLWSAHSTLAVSMGQSVNIEGGLLQGLGTVEGNLINSGMVHPGDGPGVLTVMGNYTQNSGGILDIAIGGSMAGSGFSALSVSGTTTLNGGSILDVSLFGIPTITVGEKFVILTSSDLVVNGGGFAESTVQVGGVTFDVEYSPAGYQNDVVLLVVQASSVPEPASLVLLGIGIAGVGIFVARRRRKSGRNARSPARTISP